MVNEILVCILPLLVVLVLLCVFFAFVDKLLKGGASKKIEDKKPAPKTELVEKPVAKLPTENQPQPVMQIYNSELADDLNAMLKETKKEKSSRLQIQNHTDKVSNISKYIQSKNYHGFDFNSDATSEDEQDENHLTFSRDDYKRFMALSNIDDKK